MELCKSVISGRGERCNIALLHMNMLNDSESAAFVSLMHFPLQKDLLLELLMHITFISESKGSTFMKFFKSISLT